MLAEIGSIRLPEGAEVVSGVRAASWDELQSEMPEIQLICLFEQIETSERIGPIDLPPLLNKILNYFECYVSYSEEDMQHNPHARVLAQILQEHGLVQDGKLMLKQAAAAYRGSDYGYEKLCSEIGWLRKDYESRRIYHGNRIKRTGNSNHGQEIKEVSFQEMGTEVGNAMANNWFNESQRFLMKRNGFYNE